MGGWETSHGSSECKEVRYNTSEMNIFDDNHLSNSTLNSSQCQDFIEIRNKVKSDAKNLRQKH